MTMKILQWGLRAPLDHHLRPVITYSSPSASMRVEIFVASEDATSGSVMQNAERMRPSSSGSSQSRCWSCVPNIARISMFPVSGAAQFSASGASVGLRPVISASGAYWRLVRPAPRGEWGRNRFQRPRSLAAALRSSMTAGLPQGSSSLATCSANTGSAG